MHILQVVEKLQSIADKKGVTPAQLCLAWVAAQGEDIIPIPGWYCMCNAKDPFLSMFMLGTKTIPRLEENWGSREIKLTPEELKEIRHVIDNANIQGDR